MCGRQFKIETVPIAYHGEVLVWHGRYLELDALNLIHVKVYNGMAAPFERFGNEAGSDESAEAGYVYYAWSLVALAEHIAAHHILRLSTDVVGDGFALSGEEFKPTTEPID